MKTIDICGKTFEVIKPRKPITDFSVYTHGSTLNHHYQKPSDSKISIYNKWCEWVRDVFTSKKGYVTNFGVSSANTFQFTLTFRLEWLDNIYVGYITRDHNRLYLLP